MYVVPFASFQLIAMCRDEYLLNTTHGMRCFCGLLCCCAGRGRG